MLILPLQYAPGQKATIFLETVDSNGVRADGYFLPVVSRIIFPDLSQAANFPQNMVKLDVGLYYYQFILPLNGISVGSYLVDMIYQDPATLINKNTAIQIIVTAPYGNYTARSAV